MDYAGVRSIFGWVLNKPLSFSCNSFLVSMKPIHTINEKKESKSPETLIFTLILHLISIRFQKLKNSFVLRVEIVCLQKKLIIDFVKIFAFLEKNQKC